VSQVEAVRFNTGQRRDCVKALDFFIGRIEPPEQSIDGDNAITLGAEFPHDSGANKASSASNQNCAAHRFLLIVIS
jgi:hypothetical protein